MKQRSLWKGLLALAGTGILASILVRIFTSFDEKGHAGRGFDPSPAFQGHMMRGGVHGGEFHHGFTFMPVLFLLIAAVAAVIFYARYRINRDQSGSEAVFTDAPYTPAVYRQADFLDEWEKQTQLEEENHGNTKKD